MVTLAEPESLDDPALLAAGRRLFAQPCAFVAGIADLAQLTPIVYDELRRVARHGLCW